MTPDEFITALRTLESDRDPGPLAGLYAEDATCGNTATTKTHTGPDGAREFWSGYRAAFDDIASEFRLTVASGDGLALEWVSAGTLAGGEQVRYEGVTVVALRDGLISRSTAYFDPRALLDGAAAAG